MIYISEFNFKNKTALIRVDYNVPIDADHSISETAKITATLPTIRKVLEDGGKVVLMSHLGRPKNGYEEHLSLKQLITHLSDLLAQPITFLDPYNSFEKYNSNVVLLENLRFYEGEKKNDPTFAKQLASWGDVYINDAFATIHRSHASTTIVPKLFKDRMAGLLMQKELENANKILKNPKKKFVLIIGGSKIVDKLKPIEKLLPLVDTLVLGGGAANTFLKAMDIEVGRSLVEETLIDTVDHLIDYIKIKKINIVLPTDAVVVMQEDEDGTMSWPNLLDINSIDEEQMILDIGPKSQKDFARNIELAQTILWSGPMGVFENEAFRIGTIAVARAVQKAVENGAFALIGGGDTASALKLLNSTEIGYISTGGSALLEYISNQKLPALLVLE
jgi:phosphoglycerate kinase